jgi:tetratricopeptide (TPR) repeat protein
LGTDDARLATTLNRLAGLYRDEKRYADAEPLYERALAIRDKALLPTSAEVKETVSALSELYRRQGDYRAQIPMLERLLTIAEKQYGSNGEETAAAATDTEASSA